MDITSVLQELNCDHKLISHLVGLRSHTDHRLKVKMVQAFAHGWNISHLGAAVIQLI